MNKLKKYIQSLVNSKVKIGDDIFSDKLENLVNKENFDIFINFIDQIYKGEDIAIFTFPFLENIENYIIKPENIDLIRKMFSIMKKEESGFDIVTSGEFGLWVYKLVQEGKIRFPGNILVLSGKIRKDKDVALNPIKILEYRTKDLADTSYIFLDDSYVYGGTKEKIKEFLKEKYNSDVFKTYAFYTHYEENPEEVYSIYCYSKEVKEKIIPIHKQLEYINKVDLKYYEDIIYANIKNGQIKDIRDLMMMIKRISENEQQFGLKEKIIIKFKNFIHNL